MCNRSYQVKPGQPKPCQPNRKNREADWKDYIAAKNVVIYAFRAFLHAISNSFNVDLGSINKTQAETTLYDAIKDISAEDGYINVLLPTPDGIANYTSGLGPKNIANFIVNETANKGEVQVIGEMMQNQIYPGNPTYDKFATPDPKSLEGTTKENPVKLTLSAINTNLIAPAAKTGTIDNFEIHTEEDSFVVDISNNLDGTKKAIIRYINLNVLAVSTSPSPSGFNDPWTPIGESTLNTDI